MLNYMLFQSNGKGNTVIIERKSSYLIKKTHSDTFFGTVKVTSPVRFFFFIKLIVSSLK